MGRERHEPAHARRAARANRRRRPRRQRGRVARGRRRGGAGRHRGAVPPQRGPAARRGWGAAPLAGRPGLPGRAPRRGAGRRLVAARAPNRLVELLHVLRRAWAARGEPAHRRRRAVAARPGPGQDRQPGACGRARAVGLDPRRGVPRGHPGATLGADVHGAVRDVQGAPQPHARRAHRRGRGDPEGVQPPNARHSFAVRKRRAGWPDWKIAEYLGNTAQEVARTYGAFQPTREDLIHDETARRRHVRGASRPAARCRPRLPFPLRGSHVQRRNPDVTGTGCTAGPGAARARPAAASAGARPWCRCGRTA